MSSLHLRRFCGGFVDLAHPLCILLVDRVEHWLEGCALLSQAVVGLVRWAFFDTTALHVERAIEHSLEDVSKSKDAD